MFLPFVDFVFYNNENGKYVVYKFNHINMPVNKGIRCFVWSDVYVSEVQKDIAIKEVEEADDEYVSCIGDMSGLTFKIAIDSTAKYFSKFIHSDPIQLGKDLENAVTKNIFELAHDPESDWIRYATVGQVEITISVNRNTNIYTIEFNAFNFSRWPTTTAMRDVIYINRGGECK